LNETVELTLIATGAGPCPAFASTMPVTITGAPVANAGADSTLCTSEVSYTLAGTAENYSSVAWTTSGTGTFNDPAMLEATYTPSPDDFNAGSVTLTLTAFGNGSCGSISDAMMLTLVIASTAYAGNDTAICEGDTFTAIEATASNYTSILWTTSGTGVFNDSTIVNPTYIPGPEDIVNGGAEIIITAEGAGTCPAATDTLILIITGAPVVNAGVDSTLCTSEVSYTLQGTASDYSSVLWTTSGNGIFNDPTILTPTYTPDVTDFNTGFVSLTLMAFGNGACGQISDDMILTLVIAATAYAGNDTAICEGDTFQLTEATASNYTSLAWTTSGTGTFNDTTILNPVYTPSTEDIIGGSVTLTLTATGEGTCPDAVTSMVLSITPAPIASAGSDTTMCTSEISILLSGTASNYSSVIWTTGGNGTFNDPSILTPTYTPDLTDINAGIVTLTLTAFGNGSCGTISDSLTLTILKAPTAYAGSDAAICEGDNLLLIGADADNYTSLLWTTSGTGTFNDSTIRNPVYTPSMDDIAGGNVTLTLTATGEGSCPDAVSSMTLSITMMAMASAGEDTSLCSDSYITLSGSAANYSTILWTTSGNGTFSDPTILTPTYTPDLTDIQTGLITLTLTAFGNGSCGEANDTIVLTIIPQAVVYAGDNDTICEGSSYQLAGAHESHTTGFYWTTSGTGTFDDTTILHPVYTPSLADVQAGSVMLILTSHSIAPCGPVSDTLTLSIVPHVIVEAGADAIICRSDNASLTLADAIAANYSSLAWTTGGSGTFSDSTVLHPVYTPSAADMDAGTVILTLHASGLGGNCPSDSSEMILTITTLDTEAVIIHATCEDEPDGSVVLTALGGTLPHTYTLNGISNSTGQFTGLLPGTYAYQVTDSIGCIVEGTVTIGVVDDVLPELSCPPSVTVTADEGECFALDIDLGIPVATDNCGVASVTSDFAKMFPTGQVPVGSYTVTWTVIDIHGNPDTCHQLLTVIDTEPPVITCQDMYVTATGGDCSMFVSVPVPVVSDNCGVKSLVNSITGTGIATGVYPLGVTKITWTVEDVHGNTTSCLSYVTVVSDLVANDDYASTMDNSPVNIFILGNDLYCNSNSNPITVTVIEDPAHGIYFLNNDIRFLDYVPDFGFFGVDSLRYELCDYTGACDTATVYIIVEYLNDKPVAIDDLDSTSVNIPVVIHQLANDYDPDGRIIDFEIISPPSHGASVKIMVDSTILYSPYNNFVGTDQLTYAIYDDGNPQLSDTAKVVIHVFDKDIYPEPPFIIYNALTPNDDGVNDYWKIKGIELFPDNKVVIMDRWGEIIAEFEHYDNASNHWAGLDKEGNMVPNGTYYYFLTISGYGGFYKGWVFLFRD
jgi:gliding motility-associated-like protein